MNVENKQTRYAHIPRSVIKTSRQEHEWQPLKVYQNINQSELDPCEHLQEVPLPKGLNGYVFIVGALFQEEGESRDDGTQLYTGDGMSYRLGFEDGQAMLKTRIAKTPDYYADVATQFYLRDYINSFRPQAKQHTSRFARENRLFSYMAAFRNGGPSRFSLAFGSRNHLNTAFLKTRKHLLLTMDAGRPYQIDPDDMSLVEPAGAIKDWLSIFPIIAKLTWLNIFDTFINSAHYITDVKSKFAKERDHDFFITTNYSTGYNGKYNHIVNPLLRLLVNSKLIQIIYKLFGQEFDAEKDLGNFTHLVRYFFDDESAAKATAQPADDSTQDAINSEHWKIVLPDGKPLVVKQSLHQLAITEDYIVLADIAFKMEFSQIFSPFIFGFLKFFTKGWRYPIGRFIQGIFQRQVKPFQDGYLYIIKRADLECVPPQPARECSTSTLTAIPVQLPREISHFAVDYSNPDNKLMLHAAHPVGWDVTEWITAFDEPIPGKELRKDLQGMMVGTTDLNSLGRYTINAETGKLEDAKMIYDADSTWSLSVYTHRDLGRDLATETADEVKNMYWLSLGFAWDMIPDRIYQTYQKADRNLPLEQLPDGDKPISLLRVDTVSMEIADAYAFPSGCHVSSIQFVPSSEPCPDGIDESVHGFIVCTVLSDQFDEFWIFHADDFNRSVYRLSTADAETEAINLAMTIHSTWTPNLKGFQGHHAGSDPRQVRQAMFERDYQEIIAGKPKVIQSLFNDIVRPNFVNQTLEEDFEAKLDID